MVVYGSEKLQCAFTNCKQDRSAVHSLYFNRQHSFPAGIHNWTSSTDTVSFREFFTFYQHLDDLWKFRQKQIN